VWSTPISDRIGQAERPPTASWSPVKTQTVTQSQVLAGNRVLLVEDEALVAMVMRDMLTEFGLTVVGPFSRMSEAIAAATREDVDAAVLDINLDGGMVFSLARLLSAPGLSFPFVHRSR